MDGEQPTTSGRGVSVLVLDRDAFKQQLTVPALRVPVKKINTLMKSFHGFTLDRPKLKCIASDGSRQDTKLLLLEEGCTLEGLPAELRELLASEQLELTQHDVAMDYRMLNADQVLKRLLPAGVDAPSSFETVGHIAHLNLRAEQLPYRHVIGAVLLDKNPALRTIVNKLGSIENEFRVFQMEVIAGDPVLETEVIQHGSRFKLDFSQVYWNSRLESEHLRLVSALEPGQVLVDMMAGIGPFAVPAAQRGLTVYANDLNPCSTRYMAVNVRLNRVAGGVHVFNMDGRAFLRLLCATPGGPVEQLPPPPAGPAAAAAGAGADAAGGGAHAAAAAAPAAGQEAAAAGGAAGAAPPAAVAGGPGQGAAAADPSSSSGGAARGPDVCGGGGAGDQGCAEPGQKPAKRQRLSGTKAAAAAAAEGPLPPMPEGFRPPPGGLLFDHVVMNLPASAIEFLDAFSGAFDPARWRGRLPMVHCYTFKRAAETEEDILSKAEGYLGGPLERPAVSVHTVRDVAPNKIMLCLSFRLPEGVAFKGRL